jgi:hypothetical protein
MSTRLNARIDAELARKVALLRAKTKQSTTDVVRAALECYYEQVTKVPTADALRSSGFVGCADGPSDLSSDYKRHLIDSLSRKPG